MQKFLTHLGKRKEKQICIFFTFVFTHGCAINAKLLPTARLRVRRTNPALVIRARALFQRDYAKPHTDMLTKTFKETDIVEILPHPPFSAYVAPSNYDLFRSMAHFLHDQRLNASDEFKEVWLQLFDSKDSGLVSGTDSDAGWPLAEDSWLYFQE